MVNLVVAALAVMGIELTPEIRDQLAQHVDALIAALLGFNGVVVWVLRKWTDTPLAGWFRRQEP
jgi:hypothetical protein